MFCSSHGLFFCWTVIESNNGVGVGHLTQIIQWFIIAHLRLIREAVVGCGEHASIPKHCNISAT